MGEQLKDVGVVDLLKADPRPSFVFNLQESRPTSGTPSQPCRVAYANGALTRDASLASILSDSPPPDGDEFWRWVQGLDHRAASSIPS
jgi:hypothetical protein